MPLVLLGFEKFRINVAQLSSGGTEKWLHIWLKALLMACLEVGTIVAVFVPDLTKLEVI